MFQPLAERLELAGRYVVAVDLLGHGQSPREPPWDTQAQVDAVLDTLDSLGVEHATWVGHSYGGLLCASVAARVPGRVSQLALLDPALEIPADYALASAEVDRLDWSFTGTAGAVAALLSSPNVVAAPEQVVADYVARDLRPGPDGLLRFSFCRSAVVVLWSDMVRRAPPVAQVPTLLIRPVASFLEGQAQDRRYREELGSLLKIAAVPNGHNVLWESPLETTAAVMQLLGA